MPDEVWVGDESLRPLLVPVGSLQRHPRNPRRGQVAMIAESLARFGQTKPILFDGPYVIAGNHTYAAAVELGWTHVAAMENHFASEEEARAYLLADNRIPELGGYDDSQLRALLEEIEQAGSWEGIGYTADDLDDLRALQGAVAITDPEPFAGDFAATQEELDARAALLGGGRTLSEVALLLTDAQDQEFRRHVVILRKEYGGSGGVTEVVARAVREAAARG